WPAENQPTGIRVRSTFFAQCSGLFRGVNKQLMKPNVITKTCKLPDGRSITIETGKLARQADGAVVVRMGNTLLLATVVASDEAKEGADFLPLSVDYQEKFASTGKVPGGFLKRESKLSDYE